MNFNTNNNHKLMMMMNSFGKMIIIKTNNNNFKYKSNLINHYKTLIAIIKYKIFKMIIIKLMN